MKLKTVFMTSKQTANVTGQDIAEAYFDSGKVLTRLIEDALNSK